MNYISWADRLETRTNWRDDQASVKIRFGNWIVIANILTDGQSCHPVTTTKAELHAEQ